MTRNLVRSNFISKKLYPNKYYKNDALNPFSVLQSFSMTQFINTWLQHTNRVDLIICEQKANHNYIKKMW